MHAPSLAAKFSRSTRRKLAALVTAVTLFALCPFAPARAQSTSGSPDLVISQIYTRGGETGALFQNDFVELFNRGSADADLTGWGLSLRNTDGFGASAVLLSVALITKLFRCLNPPPRRRIESGAAACVSAPLPS
jgi:uncharacterized protein